MPERANSTVSREPFEALREAKDDDETWDTFLRNACLDRSEPTLNDVLTRLDDSPTGRPTRSSNVSSGEDEWSLSSGS